MDEVEYQSALASLERLRPTRLRPTRLASALTALTFVIGPRRISRTLARKARIIADQLARIDPPLGVAAEHSALIRALRETASELDELARRKGLRAYERFEAIGEVDFAEAELCALEAKGYRLPK